jgi:hypothetical protein
VSRFRSSYHLARAHLRTSESKDTSNALNLVWLWFRSPQFGLAATTLRISEPPHQCNMGSLLRIRQVRIVHAGRAARRQPLSQNVVKGKSMEALAGRGQGGPCLTDAARSAAPDALVRYLPLRRNPNIAAAIIAAWVTRWHRASSLRWRGRSHLMRTAFTSGSCVRTRRLSMIAFSPIVSSSNNRACGG